MILDVTLGVAGTLAAEFLLAHAWLWYEGGGSNTVTKAVTTIEADVSALKAKTVTLEQTVVADVKSVANTAKNEVDRVEKFFGDWLHPNTVAQTAPVAQSAPVAQTAPVAQSAPTTPPATSSGGTPVPSVSL